MNSHTHLVLCAMAAFAAALAGCGRNDRRAGDSTRDLDSRFPGGERHDAGDGGWTPRRAEPNREATDDPSTTIDVAADVVFVDAPPESYPQRAYYYGSNDVDHVYYYDARQPDVVAYRQVFRDRDRPYYVEHESDRLLERRVFFDDAAARARRVERTPIEREPLERAARERDQNEREDWTSRRAAAPRRPAAPQSPATKPSPRDDRKDRR